MSEMFGTHLGYQCNEAPVQHVKHSETQQSSSYKADGIVHPRSFLVSMHKLLDLQIECLEPLTAMNLKFPSGSRLSKLFSSINTVDCTKSLVREQEYNAYPTNVTPRWIYSTTVSTS